MDTQAHIILEIAPNTLPDALLASLGGEVRCVGLVASETDALHDYQGVLGALPVPCVGLAIVRKMRLRRARRLAVDMALSKTYACPCRVFDDEVAARRWLAKRTAQ